MLLSRIAPIASSCHQEITLLQQYMNYTPFDTCPEDNNNNNNIAEQLMLRGCHPLPRRRCFQGTTKETRRKDPYRNPGFDPDSFLTYKSELDLTIPQLMDIAKRGNSVIRLGVDIGGGTGSFAWRMKERNVTVITTTMNLGVPYSELTAKRGVVPLHVSLQQRLPVFDGVLDLVRCGRAVNRWIPLPVLEFLLLDVDRVLRGGGYLWVDHFFSKEGDLSSIYKPLMESLGYKIVKWATGKKRDFSGRKNGEVYLTALLQKPKER